MLPGIRLTDIITYDSIMEYFAIKVMYMKADNLRVSERSSYWDNMKGVLIALVVFGHCLYNVTDNSFISQLVNAIYFFHIPAFVFVSGFFSKSENSRSARSLVRLLSAYILLNGVHLLMVLSAGHSLSITVPYYSSWYLLALIVWRLITPYFSRTKWSLALFVAISLLAGLWTDIGNQFALSRIISLYPFFLAGFFLSKESAAKLISISAIKKIPLGFLCFGASAAAAFFATKLLHIERKDLMFIAYNRSIKLQAAGRISIFIIASVCILGLMLVMPKRNIPLLTKAGRNSLAIFLIHRPIIIVADRFVGGLSTQMLLLYAAAFTIIACLVLGSDFVTRLLDKVLSFFTGIILDIGDKNRALWQKLLVVAILLLLLSLPLVKIILF